MPNSPTLGFLGENADLRQYFNIERASDFQKPPFSSAQVSAGNIVLHTPTK
jgi:hypothetical protein